MREFLSEFLYGLFLAGVGFVLGAYLIWRKYP